MSQDTERRLADAIAAMSRQYPDWRFGQIVANVATMGSCTPDGHVWDLTDEAFIAAVNAHLSRVTSNLREQPIPA